MNRFKRNLSVRIYPGKKYPFQVIREITIEKTGIIGFDVVTEYIVLDKSGNLTIKAGYAWDGATSTITNIEFLLGSLVHDAFYQLMRNGRILRHLRRKVDRLLVTIIRVNGMWRIKAAVVYGLVRMLSSKYTYPGSV